MYFFVDKFVSDVRLVYIKDFDNKMQCIHFILKIFLCFEIICYDLSCSDSQKYVFMLVAWQSGEDIEAGSLFLIPYLTFSENKEMARQAQQISLLYLSNSWNFVLWKIKGK